MALGHNPKIVTNGLQLYFDMQNTVKSWKGKPTTNLIPNPVFSSGSFSPWSYQTTSNGNAVLDTTKTYENYPSVKITRTSTGGESNVWLNLYSSHGIQPNTQYTFSVSCLANNPSEAAIFSYFGTASNGFQYHSGSGNWETISHTFTTRETEPYVQLRMWHNTTILNSPVWFTKLQVEEGSFASPFTLGTRSNTEAIIDLSKNKRTITPSNLTYNSDNTFEFDGTDDYIKIGDASDFQFSTDDFSIEMWIYPIAKVTNYPPLFTNYDSWGVGKIFFGIGHNSYPTKYSLFINGQGASAVTSTDIVYNQWAHIVASREEGIMKIYLNGQQDGTTGSGEGVVLNGVAGNEVRFGKTGSNYYKGKISSSRIYMNRALTPAEIQQNFNTIRSRYGI